MRPICHSPAKRLRRACALLALTTFTAIAAPQTVEWPAPTVQDKIRGGLQLPGDAVHETGRACQDQQALGVGFKISVFGRHGCASGVR